MNRRGFILAALAAASSAGPQAAAAETYPSRPLRLIVGYAPGGQSDLIARLVARHLGEQLGATVVVENRPGANGAIGVDAAVRSTADGYTLLLAGGGALALAPEIDASVRFDPLRDLAPIARVARVPLVLVARAGLPARSAAEVIAYARSRPGQLTYASGGASAQIALESLKLLANLDIVHVPYKGTAPALLDLVAGRVDLMLADVAAAGPHAQSGALQVVASTGSTRAPSFPDVPTMEEQGIKGFVWESWQGIFAPAATPAEIVATLQQALRRAVGTPELRAGLTRLGIEAVDERPELLPALLRQEVLSYRDLVGRAGLKSK